MQYNLLIDNLQNLTMSKVNLTEIAEIINIPVRTLYTRGQRNSNFTMKEIKAIEEYYNIDLIGNKNCSTNDIFDSNDTSCPYRMNDNCPCKEQFDIQYLEILPEEAKLPEITSIHVDAELVATHWHRNSENLRIIPMQGDCLSTYTYPILNRDVLIVDINSNVPTREGIYVYSAKNNTMIFVAKVAQLMDGTIKIEKFEANGEVTEKLVSPEKQKEVDFKIIGRVVKNVSLTL